MSALEKLKHMLSAIPATFKARLPVAIESAVMVVPSRAGNLFVYDASRANGTPVILIHGIHAAASSYEVRPLFEGLRGTRSVLAFDLPGFGLSERRNISYDSLLFRDAMSTIVAWSRARHQKAADVVAFGPSSELAAAAALDAPDDFRSLTLVAPTGFHAKDTPAAEPSRLWNSALGSFLGGPLFSVIASPPSIRRHLAKSFVGPVDRGLLDYACLSARLPGASAAPLAFLAGRLSDPEVRTKVYERLTCPVQVIFDESPYGEPEDIARAAQILGWTATRIERTRGMPQFEQTERTLGALVGFWNRLEREEQRMALSGPHQPGWIS